MSAMALDDGELGLRAKAERALFVGGIPPVGVTSHTLRQAFEELVEVQDVHLVMQTKDPTRNRGFGWLTLTDPSAAERLLEEHPSVFVADEQVYLRKPQSFKPEGVPFRKNKHRLRVKALGPGVVKVKGLMKLAEQQQVLNHIQELGEDPSTGFYTPTFANGHTMKLEMFCLGMGWDPATGAYSTKARPGEDPTTVPPIPEELQQLAARAASVAARASGEAWDDRPDRRYDICIVNRYIRQGSLGMHKDSSERVETIAAGEPVVSVSLGAAGKFDYVAPQLVEDEDGGPSRAVLVDANEHNRATDLWSGEAILFGGPARLMTHGIRKVLVTKAPRGLVMEPQPFRINLTFRMY